MSLGRSLSDSSSSRKCLLLRYDYYYYCYCCYYYYYYNDCSWSGETPLRKYIVGAALIGMDRYG